MKITETLRVKNRLQWRKWLEENHSTKTEIWLVYYRKDSGKPRIPYDDAVEEAICYGWIDGIAKKFDEISSAQRFTPRRAASNWSELNKERARRLIKKDKMTEAGFAKLGDALEKKFKIPDDILQALKSDERVWKNFKKFPESYQQIRIGYIEEVRKRPEFFEKRLANFLKMTARDKKFGTLR